MALANIKVEGLRELGEKLKGMPDKLGGEALAKSLGAAAQLIKEDARKRAPLAEHAYWLNMGSGRKALAYRGWLRDQIIQKRTLTSKTRAETIIRVRKSTGWSSRPAFFWQFIEYGHFARKSKAVAKKDRHLRNKDVDTWIPARPFMRPAYYSHKRVAIEKFKEKLKEIVDKERVS